MRNAPLAVGALAEDDPEQDVSRRVPDTPRDLLEIALLYATSDSMSSRAGGSPKRRPKSQGPADRQRLPRRNHRPRPNHAMVASVANAAIGINCGRSGLVVIDCDRDKPLHPPYDTMPGIIDGEDVLAVIAEDHGGFPWTRSVRTPSGGVHLYYTAPTTGPVPPSSGKVGPMVDVRGGESYVIAAGSWADGKPYTLLDSRPIQPLPEWLAKRCRKNVTPIRPAGTTPRSRTNGKATRHLKSSWASSSTASKAPATTGCGGPQESRRRHSPRQIRPGTSR